MTSFGTESDRTFRDTEKPKAHLTAVLSIPLWATGWEPHFVLFLLLLNIFCESNFLGNSGHLLRWFSIFFVKTAHHCSHISATRKLSGMESFRTYLSATTTRCTLRSDFWGVMGERAFNILSSSLLTCISPRKMSSNHQYSWSARWHQSNFYDQNKMMWAAAGQSDWLAS